MDCDKDTDTDHIRVLPDACVELFVNYTETPVAMIGNELHKRSIITSRMSRPMDVQMRKGTGCLAVCFYPGMAYNFFNVPMHVLTDATVSLSDLWQDAAAEIEDRLASAGDDHSRIDILQRYLLKKMTDEKPDTQMVLCMKQMQELDDSMSVSRMTNDIGISQRHLSRKFQQYLGLSPKAYLRVSRFIRSIQSFKKYPSRSLTEIAYDSGYYDQSHFIRDYRTYTGYAPGELIHAKHVVLY
jgi:AraC-like DNA-binding protein